MKHAPELPHGHQLRRLVRGCLRRVAHPDLVPPRRQIELKGERAGVLRLVAEIVAVQSGRGGRRAPARGEQARLRAPVGDGAPVQPHLPRAPSPSATNSSRSERAGPSLRVRYVASTIATFAFASGRRSIRSRSCSTNTERSPPAGSPIWSPGRMGTAPGAPPCWRAPAPAAPAAACGAADGAGGCGAGHPDPHPQRRAYPGRGGASDRWRRGSRRTWWSCWAIPSPLRTASSTSPSYFVTGSATMPCASANR